MNIKQKEAEHLFKTGVFIAVLIFVTMLMTIFLGRESALFESKIDISSVFPNAENLRDGAKVKLKGIKVGHVDQITFVDANSIRITMKVLEKYSKLIKSDAIVAIKTQGMLGDKYVEIYGGTNESSAIVEGSELPSDKGFEIKDFINQGGDLLGITTKVLSKMDTLLSQLNENQNIYETMNSLTKTSKKLEKMMSHVNPKKFGRFVNNMDQLSTRMTEGPGTLHSLIYDQSAYEELRLLLGGAQRNKVLKYFIRQSIQDAEAVENK